MRGRGRRVSRETCGVDPRRTVPSLRVGAVDVRCTTAGSRAARPSLRRMARSGAGRTGDAGNGDQRWGDLSARLPRELRRRSLFHVKRSHPGRTGSADAGDGADAERPRFGRIRTDAVRMPARSKWDSRSPARVPHRVGLFHVKHESTDAARIPSGRAGSVRLRCRARSARRDHAEGTWITDGAATPHAPGSVCTARRYSAIGEQSGCRGGRGVSGLAVGSPRAHLVGLFQVKLGQVGVRCVNDTSWPACGVGERFGQDVNRGKGRSAPSAGGAWCVPIAWAGRKDVSRETATMWACGP